MLKFHQFDRRSGEMVDLNPCLMSFGITEALIPIITSLATSAGIGATTAGVIGSIAAPALLDAGIGAGVSGLLGGNVGMGALLGGFGGALGPSLNALGITGAGLGGGALTGQAAQDLESGASNAGAAGAAASTPIGVPGLDGNTLGTNLNYGTPNLNTGTPSGAGGTTASVAAPLARAATAATPGTGGAVGGLGLGNMVGLLAALSAQANRPATTTATPPAGFSTPWNPSTSGSLARTQTPFTPTTGSYYTYGQQAEPQFFSGNALNFGTPGGGSTVSTIPGMAKGGALRHAIRNGRYNYAGGGALSAGFSNGGGEQYPANRNEPFYSGGGEHLVNGVGGGQDDNVNAKLSPGEWVADANFVSALGDGSNEEGSRRLYAMRKAVMHDKGMEHDVPPKLKKNPLSYVRDAA